MVKTSMKDFIFTSESVSEGHPDKMADQISDKILDTYLEKDHNSRVACETLISNDLVVVAGEVSSQEIINDETIKGLISEVVKDIGYDSREKGFDYKNFKFIRSFNTQSSDIALGVDQKDSLGAGDQGLMFGYATDETPHFMPLSIDLAHKLLKKITHLRKSDSKTFLRPDSKSQVSVEYENNKIKRIDAITLSTQHSPDVSQKQIKEFVMDEVIFKEIPSHFLDKKTKYFINPTGKFVIGGPQGDCGLTGRKVVVDTYGGHGAHGGGAFSGKDPSKVDRSAAYMARHIAKHIVASKVTSQCLIQLSYAIGVSEPVSIMINTYGKSMLSQAQLEKAIRSCWDLTPKGIINHLNLLKQEYFKTAAYGHFGREDEGFLWEDKNVLDRFKDFL